MALAADGTRYSLCGMLLATALLGVWMAWAFVARLALYAVTETARLEVDRAVHYVEAPVAGRVVATHLDLGREVPGGAVLVELEVEPQRLHHAEERARLAALSRQIEAVSAEIAAAERALGAAQRTAQVALEEAGAKLRETQAVAQFATQEAARATRLHARGYLADVDLQRTHTEAHKQQAAADSLQLAISRLQRQHQTQENDRQTHLQQLKRERTRLEGEQATARATTERLGHEVQRRLIRAPVGGRLGEIVTLRQGAYVQEGDKLAAVVPEGDLKIVADFLPPLALGRIRAGQPARLRLDSFHWAQYGSIDATVISVASEAHNGRVRVELRVAPEPLAVIPLQHGLTGALEVEVDRVTPAALVLRTAGRLLASPRTRFTAQAAQDYKGAR
jgi:membrane fusion protein (multidrug efflux system)